MTRIKMFISLLFLYIPVCILGQGVSQDSLRPEEIAASIKNESFSTSKKKKDIPRFIRRKLTKIDKSKFRIADEGEEFNSGDALQKGSLPNKRVVYIAYNKNFYIITYEQGGFGRTYCGRIVKYQERDIECVTTLIVPPHANVDAFKRIMEKREMIKYVADKSLCLTSDPLQLRAEYSGRR